MINIKKVKFNYKKQTLFNEINLTLNNGSIFGLLGKNGAGKTTFLKLIAGLLKPEAGECSVNGFNSFSKDPYLLNDIYFLPEVFYSPDSKVSAYAKRESQFYPNFNYAEFEENLDNFEIDKNKKISSLSMGQRKKVFISFGLAANTSILILDEPTNGLDIPAKSQFRKMITSSISDEKIFIISTHQILDVKNLVDSVLILENGEFLLNKPIWEIENIVVQKNVAGKTNNSLYTEKSVAGELHLCENVENEHSEIDLEFLFNAVISKNENLISLFNGGRNE